MKKALIIATLLIVATSANAQKMFDFTENNHRYEIGLNIGQAGSFSPYHDFAMGFSLNAWGVYLDIIKSDAQHKYDNHVSDTQYNDTEAFSINLGYQIPVVKWLRLMPLIGYSQTNEGITDCSTVNISGDEYSASMYHDYDVTPGSRRHYLNYGGGIVIQPIDWLGFNIVATRNALYGGISFNILGIAER